MRSRSVLIAWVLCALATPALANPVSAVLGYEIERDEVGQRVVLSFLVASALTSDEEFTERMSEDLLLLQRPAGDDDEAAWRVVDPSSWGATWTPGEQIQADGGSGDMPYTRLEATLPLPEGEAVEMRLATLNFGWTIQDGQFVREDWSDGWGEAIDEEPVTPLATQRIAPAPARSGAGEGGTSFVPPARSGVLLASAGGLAGLAALVLLGGLGRPPE
jgi:hypothetical protein